MPNDGVPFYLKIDNVSVSGGNTQNITDVWVQANSTNLGAYELPCNFPVLEQNAVHFTVSAGVWQSGQSDTRVTYPFYLPDTFTINATPGLKYSRALQFKYVPAALFSFNEDFENGTDYSNMPQSASLDTNNQYGNHCGVITVNSVDSNVVATQVNAQAFSITQGSEVWLEVDYKCTVPFWIGFNSIYSNETNPYEVLLLLPRTNWSKVYIKLTDLMGQAHADKYTLFFNAIKPVGYDGGGNVYLDNIKVVHF